MANITSQNNIRYNIDQLNPSSTGVITTKGNAVNLTQASTVSKIIINGTQPASCSRYFAFKVNNSWGKLSTSGTFTAFSSQTLTYDYLAANGNTPAQLTALTSIPALAGKTFDIAIALGSDDPINNGVPTCSLSFSCVSNSQVLTTTQTSPEYALGSQSQIISLTAETTQSSGGSVNVQARITRPDGTVSDWGALNSFSGQKASAVQFRGAYTASTVGTSQAKIESANILYSDGTAIMNGANSGDLITLTQDWYMPVNNCRLTVKHAPLEDARIDASIALRSSPVQILRENIGVGTGARKMYQLAHTTGLKYDTLRLYYDNVQVFSEYEFNCEAGRVTCEAPEGVIITADYEYGWSNEVWEPMTLSSRLSMDGYDQSEYRYSMPDSEKGNKSVSALKLSMSVESGHITNEKLGTSTGKTQSFRLTRRINDGSITLTANGAAIPAKNWKLLDDPRHVAVTAAYGQTIRASYDWISDTPTVYEFYAVYSE